MHALLALPLLLLILSVDAQVSWNITVSTPVRKGSSKTLLLDVCGQASKGKLHAIVGPSGSGKSTLLNTLAGVVPKKSLQLFGSVSMPDASSKTVYIQQEDLLFAQLTVVETLDTSAALRSSSSSDKLREDEVESIILNLGLKKSKATPVGDAKTRGLSGGEKKRLSIGNELVGCDSGSAVIFADEPTSGLDSFQAERVAHILQTLAEEGNTVIASIHQPRASVYALFDEITLMSEGRVVYSGPTSTVASFFAAQGFPCPNNISPPEFYVDLISVDYSSPEAEEASKRRIFQLADAMTASQKQQQPSTSSSVAEDIPVAVPESYSTGRSGSRSLLSKLRTSLRKFSLLYQRAWRNVSRDKSLFIARFASNIFSALLFGAIYFRLGDGASTVPDRLGLLQVAAVNTAMTSLIKATTTFVTEKLIVQRERRSEAYAVTPYFVSKLLAEAPISAFFPCLAGGLMYKLCGLNPAPGRLVRFISILVVESFTSSALGMAVGSLASSVESAVAIAPSVMVIFIVFGGLYVVNTPSYLAWVPKVSLIRWAYEALCVNEFSDLKFKPEARMGPLAVTKGEQVLESMGMGKSTVKKALISQASIMLANYLFTIVSLVLQKPSFEKIKPRPIADSSQASTNGISIKTPMKPF